MIHVFQQYKVGLQENVLFYYLVLLFLECLLFLPFLFHPINSAMFLQWISFLLQLIVEDKGSACIPAKNQGMLLLNL